MAKVKRRRGQRRTSAWSRGETRNSEGLTFKEVARAQLRLINSTRRRLEKCSATAKTTGERCGQLAMGNGKCRFHGGKTPSGDNWHVIQSDVSGHKTSMARFDRKVAKAEKSQKARRQKLKIGSDEDRANYEKWVWSHPPGSEKRRAVRRLKHRIAHQERLLPKVTPAVVDTQTQAIMDRIAELEARRAYLEAWTTGVFS